MNASTFTIFRLALAVLTLLALAVKPHIPPKILVIHPSPQTVASIFAPPGAIYGDDYAWADTRSDEWRCHFNPNFGPLTCGWNLGWQAVDDSRCLSGGGYPKCSEAAFDDDSDGWGWENGRACIVVLADGGPSPEHPQSRKAVPYPAPIATNCPNSVITGESAPPTMDFSGYDGINIHVHYEGKAEYLRLYLRNFNPVYTDPADINTSKFISAFLPTEELKAGPLFISKAELGVEEWWVLRNLKRNTDQKLALPEFDRIVSLGIDHVERGVHRMRVDRVELVGQRMAAKPYLISILLIWAAFLAMELSVRTYGSRKLAAHRRSTPERGQDETTPVKKATEVEVKLGKTPALTDELTGAYNRAGVEQQIGAWYAATTFPPAFSVIMLDVDHFSSIRESAGWHAANRLLQSLVALVETSTREQDIFARWDDSTFVLLSRQISKDSLVQMAEKLREKVASHYFEAVGELTITVCMGITIVCSGDTFHMALKRAEIALHKATLNGNRVIYED